MPWPTLLVHALFLVSGATALAYQVTWVRDLQLVFGSSFEATSIVLSAFMGGLALGGGLAGRASSLLARPLRSYALLELGIALCGLALPSVLRLVDAGYVAAVHGSGEAGPTLQLLRAGMAFAVVVVPTFLMGATLPVLVRFAVRREQDFGARLAWLYGVNTLGAALGALATGFVLMPAFGVWRTQTIAVIVNLAIGAVALLADARRSEPADARAEAAASSGAPGPTGAARGLARIGFLAAGVSGFCALALEVAWTRAIAITVGSTTYAFTVMLAAFLTGIGLGSALHAVLRPRRFVTAWLGATLVGIGASSLLVTAWIPRLPDFVVRSNLALYADDMRVQTGTILLAAFGVMLLPTLLMGLAFPLAAQARERLRADPPSAAGDTLALNTAGSILGALAAGFVLIPGLGLQGALETVAALDLAWGVVLLGSAAAWGGARLRTPWLAVTAVAALAALALPRLLPAWDLETLGAYTSNELSRYVGAGGSVDVAGAIRAQENEVRYRADGRVSTVAVVDLGGSRAVVVNGKVVASELRTDLEVQYLLGHLPLLLHPSPRSALVVGLGAGTTLGAVAAHAELEELVLVEIEPVVLGAARELADVNDGALDDPRLELVIQDGRNFLKTTERRFDVITSDPIHPWAAGAVYLYTREYYALARERLTPGGVMCQWWPTGDMSNQDFRTLVRTFSASFPHATLWQTTFDVVLIGSTRPFALDLGRFAERVAAPPVQRQLARLGLEEPAALLGQFAMDESTLRAFGGEGPLNTDDNLHLEFSTPLGIGGGTRANVLSLDEARASPMALIREVRPLFETRERARETIARHQRAMKRTVRASVQRGPGLDLLRKALGELPGYRPAQLQLADVLASLGLGYLAHGQLAEVLGMCEQAVELAPGNARAWSCFGRALALHGRLAEAAQALERARARAPWSPRHAEDLASVLALLDRKDEARAVLDAALERNPGHARLLARRDALPPSRAGGGPGG